MASMLANNIPNFIEPFVVVLIAGVTMLLIEQDPWYHSLIVDRLFFYYLHSANSTM